MKYIKLYEEFIAEENKSGEIYKPKRNVPTIVDPIKHPELADEFFNLINTAYAEIGGHIKVKSPSDVFSDKDWDFWEGIDIHGTEDFDIILFGSKTKYGIKFAGVGHDGTKDAKRKYIDERGKDLHKPGHYIEVSGKLAEILIKKYGSPSVNTQADVEKVLGKPVEWNGQNPEDPSASGVSWYTRKIAGHDHAKIMLGQPRV
jgi:hypothetical protein